MEENNIIDCKSQEGITIGLIDGIIAIGQILITRDLENDHVKEALKDMACDESLYKLFVLGIKDKLICTDTFTEQQT